MNETNQFLINALPFWENLTSKEQDTLSQAVVKNHYAAGNVLHTADLDCIGLLLLKKGSLRVYMLSENGREITLYRIHAGEVCILSAACVLDSITFDVSIDAVEDTELLTISSSTFRNLMEQNVYAELFAYKAATERFSDVMWAMQQILFMSFDKRLAIFLLDETAATQNDTLKITHEQIAQLTGSAREVVTRMLKYFSSEGYVELKRGSVQIKDRNALKQLTR